MSTVGSPVRLTYHVFVLRQDKATRSIVTFGDPVAVLDRVVEDREAWRRHRHKSIKRVLGGMRANRQSPRTLTRRGCVTYVVAHSGLVAAVVRTTCDPVEPASAAAAFTALDEQGVGRGRRGPLSGPLRASFSRLVEQLEQAC